MVLKIVNLNRIITKPNLKLYLQIFHGTPTYEAAFMGHPPLKHPSWDTHARGDRQGKVLSLLTVLRAFYVVVLRKFLWKINLLDSLNVQNLCFNREEQCILEHISFVAYTGTPNFLCGPNGAGKTTLLRILANLMDADSGTISYPKQSHFSSVCSFLGHKDGLKDNLSVIENLMLELRICGLSPHESHLKIKLTDWGLDSSLWDKPIQCLSLGQRKRASLCLLQGKQARVWLLDEPFSALDPLAQSFAFNAMKKHSEAGGIVLLSQHQPPVNQRIAYDFGVQSAASCI